MFWVNTGVERPNLLNLTQLHHLAFCFPLTPISPVTRFRPTNHAPSQPSTAGHMEMILNLSNEMPSTVTTLPKSTVKSSPPLDDHFDKYFET